MSAVSGSVWTDLPFLATYPWPWEAQVRRDSCFGDHLTASNHGALLISMAHALAAKSTPVEIWEHSR